MNALVFLSELPLSRVIFLSLLLCGLYYMISFDSGDRFKQNMVQSQERIKQIQQELEKVNKDLAEIEALRAVQEKDAERLKTLLAFIPEKLSKVELMRTLSNEAKAVGANINSIQDVSALGSMKNEFYAELNVDMELTGNFGQLMLFLSNLTKLNQILTLSSLNLRSEAGGQDQGSLQMSTQVRGYRYLGQEEDGGVLKK